MALNHNRLGLENKSGRIFLRLTSLLYKILPASLGMCKPAFYTFYTSHLRWNSTIRPVFIIQTSDRMQSILQYKLHFIKIQDETVKKFPKSPIRLAYTCQLFLRYKREIFIVGVLGFLQTTRSFPKIPKVVRSLPKTSEVCWRRSYRENAYPQNQRSRGRYCYLFIYTWFSFLTWVWVNIFLEIVSSKTATTHIFQSGVRNWLAGVRSKFSTRRRESWQVY